MALSKKAILDRAGSFRPVEVHVPEWAEDGDDVVLVRGMTLREFELTQGRADDGKVTASLLSRCIVDEHGARVFDDSDVDMLAELPLSGTGKLSEAISRASGLLDTTDKAVEVAVQDAEGNSGATPGGDTSSS